MLEEDPVKSTSNMGKALAASAAALVFWTEP